MFLALSGIQTVKMCVSLSFCLPSVCYKALSSSSSFPLQSVSGLSSALLAYFVGQRDYESNFGFLEYSPKCLAFKIRALVMTHRDRAQEE